MFRELWLRLTRRFYIAEVPTEDVLSLSGKRTLYRDGYTHHYAASYGAARYGACWDTGVFTSKKQCIKYLEWYQSLPYPLRPTRVTRLPRSHPLVIRSIFGGTP